MGYVVMPRNQFATTKTGIVIGCAHIHKTSYEVDGDMSQIQDHLLHGRKPSLWPWVVGYIGLLCLIGALFAAVVCYESQISHLFAR